MSFDVVNLGCKVNRVESDTITSRLLSLGYPRDTQNPAVVIVNTCTVTGEAEAKTRKAVRRQLRQHPNAQVIVTGCAAVIDAEEFLRLDPRVKTVGKANVVETASDLMGAGCAETITDNRILRVGEAFPTRVGIKVQDGCNNACTYCIVHVARGASVSVDSALICNQVRSYAQAGVREFVLSGINIGAYNYEGCTLAELLSLLQKQAPQARFRISSIEPKNVTDELIEAMVEAQGSICRHLHLPLQSGSTSVLRQMARPYSAEEFCLLVEKLRNALPMLSLSTDIIVGFPGETEDDFAQTLEVSRKCAFSKIHVFRYSKREGTPAAARPDQLDPNEIARRAHVLDELGSCLRREDALRREGSVEQVIVLKDGLGLSESYFEVRLDADKVVGEMNPELLTHFEKDGVFSL